MRNTPEELRGQVAEARERLGATVEELAARADVKRRAQHKAAEVRRHVQHTAERAAQTGRRRRVPIALAGAGLVLAAVTAVLAGRDRRRQAARGRARRCWRS